MRVSIDWLALVPVLAPAVAALVVLLVDAVVPRARTVHLGVVLVALGMGIAAAAPGAWSRETVRTLCMEAPDGACLYGAAPMAAVLQIAALGAAAVVVLMLLGDRWGNRGPRDALVGGPAVTAALVLASTAGATGVVAAQDIGTWLVTLELATLPMVALVALAAGRRAIHGSLTLLVTSVLSFALLALGAALWVVATGHSTFASSGVRDAWASDDHRLVLVTAVLVILAGVGFKLSLVPFHTWTPVTYASAATPVTLALATISKIAGLGALVVVVRAFSSVTQDRGLSAVVLALGGVALISMLVGNLVALRQVDPVRLLAWSAIGQAGWVVLPLVALDARGADAAAGYLVAYVIATTVAFVVVHLAHGPEAAGTPPRSRQLLHTGGLLRHHLWLGGLLILALVSLAGLPPGVIGLIAKIVALQPVVAAGLWPLAVVAVIGAALGVAVYLRWIAIVLGAGRTTRPLPRLIGSTTGLTLAGVALIATSVLPALVFR